MSAPVTDRSVGQATPGPWRLGNCASTVVADQPAPGISGSEDVSDYGGHLICESVNAPNARLIAAAPDLLAALTLALEAMDHMGDRLNAMDAVAPEDVAATTPAWDAARAAIAKATGQ